MISCLFNLLFKLPIIAFWTIIMIFNQYIMILRHRLVYFKSYKTIDYPVCIKDKKYGKSKFVDIETTKGFNMEKTKLKMHYIENGYPHNPPMLFIHGFPEFWFSWRYQMEEFCKTHRVLAIDMRGYGLTDKPSCIKDYQIKHLINDIKGFLDALDIRSVILVAHDWGGVVGWYFEQSYPEMVKKYIACNIPETRAFQSVLRKSWNQFYRSWYMFFFQTPFLPEWVLSRFDLKMIDEIFTSKRTGLQKKKFSPDELLAFKANMSLPGALTSSINYYRAAFRYSRKQKLSTRTDSNRFMLIFGECDSAISVECAHATKLFVPNIELKILPGLSHWVQQDDPVLVNQLIRDFISNK